MKNTDWFCCAAVMAVAVCSQARPAAEWNSEYVPVMWTGASQGGQVETIRKLHDYGFRRFVLIGPFQKDDFGGKTYINYAIGDQQGFYYMCEAWYDGPMGELPENCFK